MTAIPGGCVEYPRAWSFGAFQPQINSNLLIDAAGEYAAYVFRAPRTGTIDSVGILTGAVARAPINGMRVSLQAVNLSTGAPDGNPAQYTVVPAGTVILNAWINTGPVTSDGTAGGSKRSVVRGELLAVVADFASFTAGDSFSIACHNAILNDGGFPYAVANGVRQAVTIPMMAILYADGNYYPIEGVYPWATFALHAVNSGTNPDETGLRVIVPFDCTVSGLWVRHQPVAGRDTLCKLYDANDNVLVSTLDDGDLGGNASSIRYITFAAEVRLFANRIYRATCVPTSTSTQNYYSAVVNSVALHDALSGGREMYWTQRVDAGAWVDNPLRRPFMGLLLSDINTGGVPRSRLVNVGAA
jgi:hypothetical protein